MEINKLDDPAWYSLNETHKDLVIDYNNMKFYDPDHYPFGGAGMIMRQNQELQHMLLLQTIFL